MEIIQLHLMVLSQVIKKEKEKTSSKPKMLFVPLLKRAVAFLPKSHQAAE